jgi:hypothetical protein
MFSKNSRDKKKVQTFSKSGIRTLKLNRMGQDIEVGQLNQGSLQPAFRRLETVQAKSGTRDPFPVRVDLLTRHELPGTALVQPRVRFTANTTASC